jgi:hypothetical protein
MPLADSGPGCLAQGFTLTSLSFSTLFINAVLSLYRSRHHPTPPPHPPHHPAYPIPAPNPYVGYSAPLAGAAWTRAQDEEETRSRRRRIEGGGVAKVTLTDVDEAGTYIVEAGKQLVFQEPSGILIGLTPSVSAIRTENYCTSIIDGMLIGFKEDSERAGGAGKKPILMWTRWPDYDLAELFLTFHWPRGALRQPPRTADACR